MFRKFLITLILLSSSLNVLQAQSRIMKEFKPVCDSISNMYAERTSVRNHIRLKSVMKRGTNLDFYFTISMSDSPWHSEDVTWFRKTLKELFPEDYKKYNVGEIYSNRIPIRQLITPKLGFDGKSSNTQGGTRAPANETFVRELDGMRFEKGMSGRHIAIWQSHGRYYEQKFDRWEWQRPCLFQTCEDMFTQSFVLPYLVPMLENAGAYVMLPRERDIQKNEIIADNDDMYTGEGGRIKGRYEEKGKWKDAGEGFADTKAYYVDCDNPFVMGSARKTESIEHDKKEAASEIIWRPNIPERGEYAVYVSYKSFKNSTSSAHYTVSHIGGNSSFVVDQKLGGSTWIYLGTFEFDKGSDGYVKLDNRTPKNCRHEKGSIVTADAVRFGGGMGNIARGGEDSEPFVSGMPRSVEGARYWLQWAGVAPEIWNQNEGESDYKDDYMCRGDWVDWLSGGSSINPSKEGKGIPVDLSFGFHTDAGVTPDDATIGTLIIYTSKSEGKSKLPSGESRMESREYAEIVQSQIAHDLKHEFDSTWRRRWIWDRSYRESRTPPVPAVLLELLSHQNFADMKYGLDPSFRFTTSRAIYKGMLKYLSNRYGVPYVVQPLPINEMSVSLKGEKAVISWKKRSDPIEPTAEAEGFILYTRVDDGGFDNGRTVTEINRTGDVYSTSVDLKPGHIYSFRIAAYNDGGVSFPSETLCAGLPSSGKNNSKKVLIVNNFDRVGGPSFFDTPTYAGFDNRLDSGVPYIKDIAYIGEMYQNRRVLEWTDDENPGFGASYGDYAGNVVAGNTFDFVYTHGKAIMKAGYPFFSSSNEAFCSDSTLIRNAWSADIICGKQVTTITGRDSIGRFSVFPEQMQNAIRRFTSNGGNVLVSGAHIGTDIWDQVYPAQKDSLQTVNAQKFAKEVLGYRWMTNYASRNCCIKPLANESLKFKKEMSFNNNINSEIYCVETPDGIVPSSSKGKSFLRYSDTDISAGICHEGKGYRTICLGFPIETIKNEKDINYLIETTLEYFSK